MAALLLATACGPLFAWPQGPSAGRHLVVKILVDLPADLRPAAQLAIDQINRLHPSEFEQTRVQAVYVDDTYQGQVDGATARQHLRRYLDDPSVLGMIGPLNRTLAHALLPIANEADLTVISPTITDECLTQVESYCTRGEPDSLRPHNAHQGTPGDLTFFRVPPLDTAQADASADFVSDTLNKQSALLVVDNTALAGRLADEFTGRIQLKGGTITGTLPFDSAANFDARMIAGQIDLAKPDVVYLATTDPAALARIAPLVRRGTVPFIVPDALHTDAIAREAKGWPHVQLLASSLSAEPSKRSEEFAQAWAKAHPGVEAPAYALETWLATRALIEAVRSASADLVTQQIVALPNRQEVTAKMGGVALPTDDLIGLSFGPRGDDESQLVTIYAARDGGWSVADQVQAA